MKLFLIGTAVNAAVNLFLLCVMLRLYRKSENLGWREAEVRAEQLRVRGKRRRAFRRYQYRVHICYEGSRQFVTAAEEECRELLQRPEGRAMVYVREFPCKFLNPDFEKYEFALRETDWTARDRRRCRRGFLAMFLAAEVILCLVAAGL